MTIPNQGYNNDQTTSFDKALTDLDAKIDDPGSGTFRSGLDINHGSSDEFSLG
ncbi:hypothetical protein LB565_07115 [Mesorhizobium sp. CA14]|uniref:hypothetical protein n=1 Tax=Mesorhizobium sp. CA14 TaxID=2876642 RepID=UPI001CCD257C|nr:hypothetical protein [Mesorhizobium sp. CA14]MBZ9847755.1 hypothetical protein [Mesorhizobium sp. CA14]